MRTYSSTPIDNERYEAAIARRIKANASKTRYKNWLAENPDAAELESYVYAKSYDNNNQGFWGSMKEAIGEWGALTEGQTKAVRNSIEKAAQRRAEWAKENAGSQHLGTVGERQSFTFKVVAVSSWDSMYGTTYFHVCRDKDANIIIYKGANPWSAGDIITCMAKVKEHGEREGGKQTIIQRPTKVTVNGETW
jgi:hypothetical protein